MLVGNLDVPSARPLFLRLYPSILVGIPLSSNPPAPSVFAIPAACRSGRALGIVPSLDVGRLLMRRRSCSPVARPQETLVV